MQITFLSPANPIRVRRKNTPWKIMSFNIDVIIYKGYDIKGLSIFC